MDSQMNSSLKNYDPDKLEKFLEKVSSKLKERVEEIGENNNLIIEKWVNEIKDTKEHIIVERNETLIQENCNKIEKSSNYNSLISEFNKLLLDNHLERVSALSFLENNFVKLYEESFSSDLESYLISVLESSSEQQKGDWVYLNAVINGLTLILKNVKEKKNFSKISSLFIRDIEKLIKHCDFRVRQTIPELLKIVLFDINDNAEIFNSTMKILLDDVCSNLVTNETVKNEPKVNTLESSKLILIDLLKESKRVKKYMIPIEINRIQELIEVFDLNSHGMQTASIDIITQYLEVIEFNVLKENLEKILFKINFCLSDYFPQVRFSALNFLIVFYEIFSKNNIDLISENKEFRELILPKICLNRYLPADGVKNSSLTLWKSIVKENGISLIKSHFPFFLETYLHEMASKSPSAKEAACRCLQELIMRVSDESHLKYIEKKSFLINSLMIKCIKDSAFNVREAALNSSGYIFNFLNDYINPEEKQTVLYLLNLHLFDSIYEVRDASAYGIKNVISNQNFKKNTILYDPFLAMIKELISSLENTEKIKKSYEEYKASIFKHIQIEPDLGFLRELELNDFMDGIIHLLKEVFECDVLKFDAILMLLIDLLCKTYKDLNNLTKKTIWITFSLMFEKVKKYDFEMYLEYFGKILANEIKENSSQVCGFEAINFVKKIQEIYGKKYVINRIKSIDNSILCIIEKN